MKKILFSDILTDLVLSGVKTQTRRIIRVPKKRHGVDVAGFFVAHNKRGEWLTWLYDEDEREIENTNVPRPFEVGEVVAIAQRYSSIFHEKKWIPWYNTTNNAITTSCYANESAGWNNKMFVKAELMPHRIKITGLHPEKLQDISDEDCLKEGIMPISKEFPGFYDTLQDAFADLIDSTCGNGTWESNPWVWVYDFELVK